jgi:hypothetical protein
MSKPYTILNICKEEIEYFSLLLHVLFKKKEV